MALDINNATYGRSSAQLNNLLGTLEQVMENLKRQLSNDTKLLEVIRKYWTGSDEERFEAKLNELKENIEQQINNIHYDVSNALDNEITAFRKNQDNIVF